MTHFRTELHIEENPDKIEYGSKILSIGSGFSNILTDHFSKFGFEVNSNPYGKIYNPLSIFKSVELTVDNQPLNEAGITEADGSWNHFDFHPTLSSDSKSELVDGLNQSVQDTHAYLNDTGFLFLTFGTAYAYKHIKTGQIVANCHRAQRNEFNKVLLSPEEIVEGFRRIYSSVNNVKNIVLIVSPIMHTGDSITLNAVSKSILRLACHIILSEFPYVKYFPAYEFLLSDLRGYRFYEKDLIHPTEQAMDYIFDKFVEAYVHEDCKKLIKEVDAILDDIDLSPYSPQSDRQKTKVKEAITKIESLSDQMDLTRLTSELKATLG